MINEKEVLMLIIGGIVLIFVLAYFSILKKSENWLYICASYFCFILAWVCTVLEGVIWEEYFDPLEHIFYLLSAICLTLWIWKSIQSKNIKKNEY